MNDTNASNESNSTGLSKRMIMAILVASVAICTIIMTLAVDRCSRDESEEATTPPAEASWDEESDSEPRDMPASDSPNTGDTDDSDTDAREKTRENIIATTLYVSVIHNEDEDGTFAIELSGDCFNPNDVPVDISAMPPVTINGTQATLMSKGTVEPEESSGYTYECTFEPKNKIKVTYGQRSCASDIDVIREDAGAAIELSPQDTAQTMADSIATIVALSRSGDERILSAMGEAPAEAEDIPSE